MARHQEYEMIQQVAIPDPKSPLSPSNVPPMPGSASSSGPPQTSKRAKQGLLRDWWLELIAVLLSAVAVVAIVVTLRPYDRQPLPAWPYTITLNTLISIYVIVFKASILFMTARALSQLKWLWYRERHLLSDIEVFDEASRGPYGSVKLLWTVNPRHWVIWIGAIVTVIMVVVGPFAQQLLTYYDCDEPLDGTGASILSSTFLESLGPLSYHIGATTNSVPPPWQQAINAGLYAPGQKMPVECPTGNCTFPKSYATVGYCSRCTDVSQLLSIENQTMFAYIGINETRHYAWGYNTSLPSGASSLSHSDSSGQYNWSSISVNRWPDEETRIDVILGQVPYDMFRHSFVDDNSTCVAQEGNTSWRCRGYGAASCSLYPCVKRFSGDVKVGSLEETVLDTSSLEQWSYGEDTRGILGTIDLQCIPEQDRAALLNANYSIADGQKWLGVNITWDITNKVSADAPFPQSLQAHGCLYAYYFGVEDSILQWLGGFFDGYVNSYAAPETDPRELVGPQNLQTIFNYGNISFESVEDTFKNISDSMTTTVRQQAEGNNTVPVTGVVYKGQTCVSVHWTWLSFPAALIIVISLFLAATILEQHKASHWLPAWKSSLLPVLVHGVMIKNRDDENFVSHGGENEELRRVAGETTVRLKRTAHGLELRES